MLEKQNREGLNAEQQLLFMLLARGVQVEEAYRQVFPKSRAKSKTIFSRVKRWMELPGGQDYYDALLHKKEDLIADRQEVLAYLTAVMRGVRRDTAEGEKSASASAGDEAVGLGVPVKLAEANKAAELLGKRYGLFSENSDLERSAPVQIIDDISEEVLHGQAE